MSGPPERSVSSRLLAALAVVVLLGGCAPAPPPLAPPPAGVVPDLRGTWRGSWGGTPLSLVVTGQENMSTSGIYVGPWPVLGQELPGIAGVLTYMAGGAPVSVNVKGRFGGGPDGRLLLVLEPTGQVGQFMTLTQVDAQRLSGMGRSHSQWDPEGPVELVRQPAP
jgi:hypothetical protein